MQEEDIMMHKMPFCIASSKIPHLSGLILVFATVLMTACTFKGGQEYSYLTEQRFPAKPATAPVDIFDNQPARPYHLIGEVSARSDVSLLTMPDSQDAINKLKAMARTMGGDAIINYRGYRAPTGTVGQGGFSAQGTVVRWK